MPPLSTNALSAAAPFAPIPPRSESAYGAASPRASCAAAWSGSTMASYFARRFPARSSVSLSDVNGTLLASNTQRVHPSSMLALKFW